jgi:hypothetical protein
MAESSSADHRSGERGIALVMALFALVVIGALVSGSFFAGWLEEQSGRNAIFAAQALEAAETGLSDVLANVDASAAQALAPGGTALELALLAPTSGIIITREIARLTAGLFLIRSTGVRNDAEGRPLATRSLGLLVRIAPGDETVPARFTPVDERAWVQLF